MCKSLLPFTTLISGYPMKNFLLSAIISSLVATNILSITNSAFHEKLFNLATHIPYSGLLKNSPIIKQKKLVEELSKEQLMRKQLLNKIGKTRDISKRIVKRISRNLAYNVTSAVGEAVPLLGTSLIIAVTVADVKDGCDTVRDINEITSLLEMEAIDENKAGENEVCGIKVPSVDDIKPSIDDIGSSIGDKLGNLFIAD
jgi:hypothetical protein